MSTPTPTTEHWVDVLSDRMNPLVIKELRQGVRSRLLWSAFALLLFVCLGIATTAFLASLSGPSRVDGQVYFGAFFFCVCFIYVFIIPSMAYQSLVREQEGETWPLLTMTGLGARRVLRGKVSSALILAALYSSVVLPFLFFAYYLNGIEIGVLLMSVGGALTLMVFLTFTSVCWATFGQTRFWRGILRSGLIFGTFMLSISVSSIWFEWIRSSSIWDTDSLIRIGVMLWQMASGGYFFYETAVARMSLDSEDFSGGPRRALLVQTIGTWVVTFLLWRHEHREATLVVVAHGGLCLYLCLVGIFISTDRYGVPKSLAHRAARDWNPFMPGAVRGFRLIVFLLAAGTAGTALMLSYSTTDVKAMKVLICVLAAGSYAVGYLSAGIIGGHLVQVGEMSNHLRSRIAFAIVLLLGCLPPVLLDSLVPILSPWVSVFSPVGGILHFADGDFLSRSYYMLGFVGVVALVLFGIADHLLALREPKPVKRTA